MKKKIVFGVVAFLLVFQAQIVFAQSYKYNDDFLKEVGKNDFTTMERLLEKRKGQIELAHCMVQILANRVNGFSSNNTMRVMQLLVKYGCNLNGISMIPEGGGYFNEVTPLRAAIEYNQPLEIIKFLIDNGAYQIMSSNERFAIVGRDGYLSQAIKNKAVIELLISKGTDINARIGVSGGFTALMREARNGNFEAVRFLVENGAKVNLHNDNGDTAASLAYDKGEIEIYNYLKANGAIDFEPRQVTQQPAAPSQSTTNNYSPPPSNSSNSSSSSTPSRNVGKEIADAFKSPLQSGTYSLIGSQEKISLAAIAKSGVISQTWQGRTYQGSYNIDGNRMTVQIRGYTFVFNITSETSFSGHGETWVRTGY